jgi:hypothetical protein
VGLVVLNYNGSKVLPGLLESLDRLDYPLFRVFLVDNASTDDSLQFVRSYRSRTSMEIIANSENLLFSGGNNVGINRALQWGAVYILLLNNDTIVPPNLLSELVAFMEEHPMAGISGPMIHFREPEGTVWFAGGFVSTWWGLVRHRGIRSRDQGQFSAPMEVDYVSGCALMARREVFERVGLLDTSFPMYYEDTDLCFRARNAGFECWYVPTAPLIHLVSAAAGGQTSPFKIRRRFASGMRFFSRHARWYQWPTILLGQVYEALRVGIGVARGKLG